MYNYCPQEGALSQFSKARRLDLDYKSHQRLIINGCFSLFMYRIFAETYFQETLSVAVRMWWRLMHSSKSVWKTCAIATHPHPSACAAPCLNTPVSVSMQEGSPLSGDLIPSVVSVSIDSQTENSLAEHQHKIVLNTLLLPCTQTMLDIVVDLFKTLGRSWGI